MPTQTDLRAALRDIADRIARLIAEVRRLRAQAADESRKNREALRDLAARDAKLAEAKRLGMNGSEHRRIAAALEAL